MIDLLTDPQVWASLFTLTLLEIVLGIDNVIFLSIVSGRLPEARQPRARAIGLGLAAAMRVVLLFSITWIIGLTQPIFSVLDLDVFLARPGADRRRHLPAGQGHHRSPPHG